MDEEIDNLSSVISISSQRESRESYFTDEDNMSGSGILSESSLSPTNDHRHKDKILKCKNCGSQFSNRQTLLIHVRTSVKCYNRNSTDSSKICSYCEKKFASKQMRLYHETKCVNKIINDLTNKHNSEMEKLTNELEILRQTINDIKLKKKENDI